MTGRIRPADLSEIDALARLWHAGWHEAHAAHVPDDLVAARTHADFKARLPALLPGLRTCGPVGDPAGLCIIREDEMHQLFVAPQARGDGTASKLLAEAEARLLATSIQEAWLDVIVENPRAIRFYEREGWQKGRCADMPIDTAAGIGTFTLHVQIMTKRLG